MSDLNDLNEWMNRANEMLMADLDREDGGWEQEIPGQLAFEWPESSQ